VKKKDYRNERTFRLRGFNPGHWRQRNSHGSTK
jgi:hypothetical protein